MINTGIYEIRNLVNGKRYIGSAVRFCNRWRVHAQSLKRGDHHSVALQRAWNLYGPSAFQFNKLLVCEKKDLILYEQACMDAYSPEYNIVPRAGSQLGYKHSEESRKRMSDSRDKSFSPMKGKKHTDAARVKISANRKGKSLGPMTAERKAKIAAANKGRVVTPEQRAKISATLMGHKQSADQIEKRVQKLRGRKMPEGFAEAASKRMTGQKLPDSHRLSIAKSKARLTEEQVREIRSNFPTCGMSQKLFAKTYDVDASVISELMARKSYAWVD